ncbi:MAG: phosphoribosylformylglycinamidine cyclo-ligase [Actinomycetota bacterium]
MSEQGPKAYADAGVDIAAAHRAVERIRRRAAASLRPEVLGELGGFGGLFALGGHFRDPVLVSSTDGAGTKVMLAQALGRHDTIGIDLVAMSVDDVAAHGAEPLFFLDYIVTGKVVPDTIDALVAGMVVGCRRAGCALIGGEIAEHPGHLAEDSYDLAGFCVGVAERSRLVTGERIAEGDAVLGIASSGLHANGYSLVRKVLADAGRDLADRPPDLDGSLADELLRPTEIYAPSLLDLAASVDVKGLAHITGGGIPENLARILPQGMGARLDRGAWPPPPIFGLLADWGGVEDADMVATFNMGIGMIAVLPAEEASAAVEVVERHGHRLYQIGEIVSRGPGPAVRL